MDSRKSLTVGMLVKNLTKVYEVIETPNTIGPVYVLRDIHDGSITSYSARHFQYKLDNESGLWNVIDE